MSYRTVSSPYRQVVQARALALLTSFTLAFLFAGMPRARASNVVLFGATLQVAGDGSSEEIAFRLNASNELIVDDGIDGTADHGPFPLTSVLQISVAAGAATRRS